MRSTLRPHWLIIFFAIVGVVFSCVVFGVARHQEVQSTKEAFARLAEERMSGVERTLRQHFNVGLSLRAFYGASDNIERTEFTLFTETLLDRYPGVEMLAWVPRVAESQRETYELKARQEGYPHFIFTEHAPDGSFVPAAQRSQYFPVYYLHSRHEYQPWIGFDLASHPPWGDALEDAHDTGKVIAVRQTRFDNISGGQRLLVFLAVYGRPVATEAIAGRRQNLQGFVIASLEIDLLLESALVDFASVGMGTFFYDEFAEPSARLLSFQVRPPHEGGHPHLAPASVRSALHHEKKIKAGERQWSVLCTPTHHFFAARSFWQPWTVLVFGLLGTIALTGYAASVQTRTARIEHLVAHRTAELSQVNARLGREIAGHKETERALRESENRYRALVENSSDLLCEVKADGTYVYVSPNYHEVLGYAPEDMLGQIAFAGMHRDDAPGVWARFNRMAESQNRVLFRVRHKNGEWRWIESLGKAYSTAQNEWRAVIVSRDVTERKRVEEALFLRDRAMGATSEGITITDPRQPGNPIVYVNSGFERLTGYTVAEMLGRSCHILQGPETDAAVVDEMRQAVQEERICTVELLNYRKDTTRFWNRVSITPVRDANDQLVHFIGIQSDITVYKELERLKDDLLSTVSHELRTPLSSISGFAELLLTRNFSKAQGREFLTIIHTEAVRLTALINDFLDLQRVAAGRQAYQFDAVDLGTLLRGALAIFDQGVSKQHFRVQLPAFLPPVHADREQIRRVLFNLLSNAVKFSPQGGEICVAVQEQAGAVVVSVADHGIGIPSDAVPKLFGKFFRVDSEETRYISGTGLGLALVKEIVEAHGGQVWVESELKRGSTFFFSLSVAESVAAPQTTDGAKPSAREDGVSATER